MNQDVLVDNNKEFPENETRDDKMQLETIAALYKGLVYLNIQECKSISQHLRDELNHITIEKNVNH
jgi:hypothetical protein